MITLQHSILLTVSAEQAYATVADVESYPDFLPGCQAVEVLGVQGRAEQGQPSTRTVRVAVAAKGMRHDFITVNQYQPFEQISMTLGEGPVESLSGRWSFVPIGDEGCRVSLDLCLEAKGLVGRTLGTVADSVADKMVDAFVKRIGERAS